MAAWVLRVEGPPEMRECYLLRLRACAQNAPRCWRTYHGARGGAGLSDALATETPPEKFTDQSGYLPKQARQDT